MWLWLFIFLIFNFAKIFLISFFYRWDFELRLDIYQSFFFYNYGHSAVIEAGISLLEALSDSAAAKKV
jgi:hypothetical protein